MNLNRKGLQAKITGSWHGGIVRDYTDVDRGGGSRNRKEKMELKAIKEEIIKGGWLFVEDMKRGDVWISQLDDSSATFKNGKYWRNASFGKKTNHWPKEDSLDPKKRTFMVVK